MSRNQQSQTCGKSARMLTMLTMMMATGVLLFATVLTAAAQGAGPAPTITGPIPVTAPPGDASHGFVFSPAAVDLASHGYIEEEFFIEGTANRYTRPEMATAEVLDSGHAYKTRFVVRRPTSRDAFNGTVVVEWNNVTAGRDLDIDWFQSWPHFVRAGYAWVGVSAQRVGVDALREWSPERYGSLDVTHDGMVERDELSYDIFAAVGRAVRESPNAAVMGGLSVDHVIATGHSQSAGRLATYLNNVHPIDPVYEGVVVHGGGSRIRDDLDVKVWKLLAETDLGRQAAIRQPDTTSFRTWEVAGSSHVDIFFAVESAKVTAAMDGWTEKEALADLPAAGERSGRCDLPEYSRVPFRYVMNAAYDHMVRWVEAGVPPPTASPVDADSVGPPAVFARDERGNATGGIRLAAHAVPTAMNAGQNTGAGFCRLYGAHEPFDAATLAGLYPSHDVYVAAVREIAEANVAAGYILAEDGEETIRLAEQSAIGR
jgi:hypothetical protein